MKTRENKIREFFKNLGSNIEVLDYINPETVECFDDVFDQINDNGGFNIEIIYYSTAIKYLQENDPSLQESLELAENDGYSLNEINSELLASLHISNEAPEIFCKSKEEIEEFFESL